MYLCAMQRTILEAHRSDALSFTQNAIDYVAGIDPKVVLIDGERLANLMIDLVSA